MGGADVGVFVEAIGGDESGGRGGGGEGGRRGKGVEGGE